MQSSKGFGLIEVVITVIIVAILAGAVYIAMQNIQKEDSLKHDQNTTAEQSDHDVHDIENWEEYSFKQYGLTFKHPQNWQIEVATAENFENQPNILVKDENNQLVLGIYGYKGNDDGCDIPAYDAENQPNLKIGQYLATLLKTCEHVEDWIGVDAMNGDRFLAITTNFLGQPQENDARKLLESSTGLMPAIVN